MEQQPAAPSEPEATTKPAEPEIPNLDMFVGEWAYLQDSSSEREWNMVINADGTLTGDNLFLDADVVYEWTMSSIDKPDPDKIKLSVKKHKDYSLPNEMRFDVCTITLTRTKENTYIANVKRSSMGTGTDFYRVGDYEVVELTAENMMQYLELEQEFKYITNEFGYTQRIENWTSVRFKEGVGFPSFCTAKFRYQMTTKEVTFDEKPDGYTLGATVKTEEGEPLIYGGGTPQVTGRYAYEFYFTEYWSYMDTNMGGQTHTCEMTFYELIGADAIVGKVFIPVAK
jgi:hypothetical protein